MGIGFAFLATRLFYPDAGMVWVMGVAIVLVGMAYIFESFRKRTKGP
jgi:membrane-bound ClpP family serine protease